MKKLAVLLMVVGLFGAMPVMAAEHQGMMMDTKEGMRECSLQAESIQQKVARLQKEINKGTKKYSAEDLKKLKEKLKDTNDILDSLNNDARYQR